MLGAATWQAAAVKRANMPPMRGFLRVNGWQLTGIVLSVLWVSCASMWFMQQIPAHQPGIASIYLQCITEPNSHRSVCNARANSFRAGLLLQSLRPFEKRMNDLAALAASCGSVHVA